MRTVARYVWWKTPDAALEHPHRVVARIMDIGLLDDIRELMALFSKEELLAVLNQAEAGQFRDRSWHFWHYYLTDCGAGEVPALPARRVCA